MSNKITLYLILLIVLSQLALCGLCYFEYAIRSSGQFYGKLPNGKVFEIPSLKRPNLSSRALLSWATLAATASYTLDFVNYKDSLEKLKAYFTPDGYDNFLNALTITNTLRDIIDKKLVLSAVAIGPAIILGEDEVRGNHLWKVEIPITVSYLSASEELKRDKLVTLIITEVPTTGTSKGIGIGQYIATDLNASVLG
jgi:intracellular multiplication protein IcmL